MNTIATKFVTWDVPALEKLSESKVYQIKQKVMNGEQLDREEKNWLTKNVNTNGFSKWGVPLMGWLFDFSDVLTRYLVRQYGDWHEYHGCDKTAIRSFLYGRIQEIIELPS